MNAHFVYELGRIITPCFTIYCLCKYIGNPIIINLYKYYNERITKKPF
jgi:hypothetical protein